MTDRQGIEIDYCPQCRGVWLDRGELDKIIDRAAQSTTIQENTSVEHSRHGQRPYQENRDHDDRKYYEQRHYQNHGDNAYYGKGYKKKKRGILGELFDFD